MDVGLFFSPMPFFSIHFNVSGNSEFVHKAKNNTVHSCWSTTGFSTVYTGSYEHRPLVATRGRCDFSLFLFEAFPVSAVGWADMFDVSKFLKNLQVSFDSTSGNSMVLDQDHGSNCLNFGFIVSDTKRNGTEDKSLSFSELFESIFGFIICDTKTVRTFSCSQSVSKTGCFRY